MSGLTLLSVSIAASMLGYLCIPNNSLCCAL